MLEELIAYCVMRIGFIPYAWRVQLAWWEHREQHTHQQVKAKFIQDQCMAMTEEQFYEWFNTLTINEFISVMLLPDPEDVAQEAIDEIVDKLSPDEDPENSC